MNIKEFENIKPAYAPKGYNFKKYYLKWSTVKKLPYMECFLGKTEEELKIQSKFKFYAQFRFDETGEIIEINVSAFEPTFGHMTYSKKENWEKIFKSVIRDNKNNLYTKEEFKLKKELGII